MKNLLLPIILSLISCASIDEGDTPLERKLGDSYWGGEIFYSQAVWFLAEPEHQFSVKGNAINIYHNHQDDEEPEVFASISFEDCRNLESSVHDLRQAVVVSIAVIAGVEPTPEREVYVLDGDWMKIRMRNMDAGNFELKGDSGTYYMVPWIKKAQAVYELAYDCATTKS